MRLALWVKASPARSLNLRLVYPVGEPLWTMQLTDGETIVFEETSESLEGVTVLAVAKLGKSL